MSRKNKGSHYNNHANRNSFQRQNFASQYQAKRIMLTISILVSGRREAIEKCVASLEHLRQTVPCELILTDTGCPAEMQGWLKEKADRVLKFQWCNDFAAARNVGVRAARGQWFMFMDDDEWFEDTTGIEAFFLSGDYKKYQSASYIVRNYVNMEGTVWRDIHLTRMTLRRPDTRFFYPIHESLWPLLDPEKHLEDYAHHYGYASEDPEVQMAKRRRNLGILLPAIEEDPHCMKHYLQAVAEYYAMDEWDEACRMADLGVANCDRSRPENAVHIDGLYAAAVRMRLRGKRNLEVIQVGTDYLEHADISDLAKASICGDLAIANGLLEEYRDCWKYLQKYLKWQTYFQGHREEWLKQETVVLDSCFENYQYRKALGWGFAAALFLHDAAGAEGLLRLGTLEWWLDAVQVWYTLTIPRIRVRWQADFRGLMDSLPMQDSRKDMEGHQGTSHWRETADIYGHLRQLYGILTMPEPGEEGHGTNQEDSVPQQSGIVMSGEPKLRRADGAAGESKAERKSDGAGESEAERKSDGAGESEAEQKPDGAAGKSAAEQAVISQEIETLAVQLKEKVRFLIQQGQVQAALGIIGQLRTFFPGDADLEELQARCEMGIQ